ncbi:MAG: protocatechuate 3,4-dioxygenase [Rhodospirillaceae bacterium]
MPRLNRRRFLATGAACLVPYRGIVAQTSAVPTPSMSLGPFYPDRLPPDRDNDLTRLAGEAGTARGEVFDLSGIVRTVEGRPVQGGMLEIWQCDAGGVYLHSASSSHGDHDPNFQGYGAATTDAEGGYRFRTITPVAYTGRTPHIHFRLRAPNGRTLVSQIFLAGHPMNASDFLFSRLPGRAAQSAASVTRIPSADGAAGVFEIVLQ